MVINLPDNVKYIIKTLNDNGYEAYAVGGCVRDTILGREPEDWDITSSAKPEETKALFRRTIDTGIEHGTVTIMIGKDGYEVTTYRIDGKYEDSRHPKEVIFTASLEEDLKRRDFTINAMAYNDTQGIVDIFGGLEDIDKKTIRAVGCAEERFSEDALRILRAVRFAAQLDYNIEESTLWAIKKLAPNLTNISAERIHTELIKMLVSNHPEKITIADEAGVLAYILKEYSSMADNDKRTTIQALIRSTKENDDYLIRKYSKKELSYLRLAILMHKFENKDTAAVEVLRRLKLDNETISFVKRLVKYHDEMLLLNEIAIRKLIVECGEDLMALLFDMKLCLCMENEPEQDICNMDDKKCSQKDNYQNIIRARDIYYKILNNKDCISMKTMVITGNDLREIGIAPGKAMGEILKYLFDLVIEDPKRNDKEVLLALAKEYVNSH